MAKADRTPDDELADAVIAANFRRQIRFWLIAAAFFGLFVYLFAAILLPFVAGMALAYFLDPIADRLERLGLSRTAATFLILLAFIVALAIAMIVLIPVLATQLADFLAKLPEYLAQLQTLITSFNPEWLERRFGLDADSLRELDAGLKLPPTMTVERPGYVASLASAAVSVTAAAAKASLTYVSAMSPTQQKGQPCGARSGV